MKINQFDHINFPTSLLGNKAECNSISVLKTYKVFYRVLKDFLAFYTFKKSMDMAFGV